MSLYKKWNKNYLYSKHNQNNNTNFLNKKKRKTSNINNDSNNYNKEITIDDCNNPDIPGFYFDKEKNRYFSLKDKESLNKVISIKKEKNFKNNNFNDTIAKKISNFLAMHNSLILNKNDLQTNIMAEAEYLQTSNKIIKIDSLGDKLSNIYDLFLNKYFILLDYSNEESLTSILVYDLYVKNIVKKLFISGFYNDFSIVDNHLILINNITKVSIISNLDNIINSKKNKLNILLTKQNEIHIKNIYSIPMVYKWPFIQYEKRNNTFYYLLWNNFLTLNIKQNDFIVKRNNNIIYLSNNEISGIPNKIEIKKIFITKDYHYINFVILEYNKFYLFTSDGEIHFYKFKKNGKFFLKEKINNDLLNNVSLVKICYYKKSNFLMISNKGILYNFDLNKI